MELLVLYLALFVFLALFLSWLAGKIHGEHKANLKRQQEKKILNEFLFSGIKVELGHPEEQVSLKVNYTLPWKGMIWVTNLKTGEGRYFDRSE